MADLGDFSNHSNVFVCGNFLSGRAYFAADYSNPDFFPEHRWNFNVNGSTAAFSADFNFSVANYKKTVTQLVSANALWMPFGGKQRLFWPVTDVFTPNTAVLTLQRGQLGSDAVVRVLANPGIGVTAQIYTDANTNSLAQHNLTLSCSPTAPGIVIIELEYRVSVDYSVNAITWSGDIVLLGDQFIVGKYYSQAVNSVSGIVQDNSVNAARVLSVHRQDTKELLAITTSSGVTGAYTADFNYPDEVFVVCFDDDGDKEALIEDRVIPG